MKKAVLLLAVLVLVVGSVWAERSGKNNPQRKDGFSFSVEPTFGIRVGKEGEIVWNKNSKNNSTYKLSELEWEYTPAWYIGTNLSISGKRFGFDFLSKFFIQANCGIIKDSDWQQDYWYKTGNTSTKTNYSESTNRIANAQDLELAFSFKFYPTSFLTLRPRISFNYSHMVFNAIGGRYWYGLPSSKSYYAYNSPNITTGSLNGIVLKYDEHNLYLWAGIQADFIPSKKIEISLASEVAVLFYTISYDTHVLKGVEYKQYSLSAFYGARQNIKTTFNLNQVLSLCINLSGIFTGETIGPTYHKTASQKTYVFDGDAGAYSMYFDAGISAKIHW